MVSVEAAKRIARSLPEVDEYMHFDKPAFRVNKKIFATIHLDKNAIMVKLSVIDQSIFCSFNKGVIFPVPGVWGIKGATFIDLNKIKTRLLTEIVKTGWKTAASPKLLAKNFGKKK